MRFCEEGKRRRLQPIRAACCLRAYRVSRTRTHVIRHTMGFGPQALCLRTLHYCSFKGGGNGCVASSHRHSHSRILPPDLTVNFNQIFLKPFVVADSFGLKT